MTTKAKSETSAASSPTPEEVVALALNEQGYLLHHKVATLLRDEKTTTHNWQIESWELPVSLPNGKETRIDLLLRYGITPGIPWRIVLECKRAARDYKRWVFFAEGADSHDPSPRNYLVARTDLSGSWDHRGEPNLMHSLESRGVSDQCPVFDYGIEAKLDRPGSGKKASGTEAIEDAFQQVTLGQAGLIVRLSRAQVLNFRVIPVVVTTAELVSAHFNVKHVALDRGMIDSSHIKLKPRRWLAVNYPVSDVICQCSNIATIRPATLADSVTALRMWTVFVVQAGHIQSFLAWLEQTFPKATP